MTWQVVDEVLDDAPADLRPQEVLVLVALAARADNAARRCWPGQTELMRRTRLSEDGLRRILKRLIERELVHRAAHGHRGARTVYVLSRYSDSPDSQSGLSPESPDPQSAKARIRSRKSPYRESGPDKHRTNTEPEPFFVGSRSTTSRRRSGSCGDPECADPRIGTCGVGWLADDPETGVPRPCPTCKRREPTR